MLFCVLQQQFCFNPRTHTGCDSLDKTSCLIPIVSIHAPTRGATLRNYITSFKCDCFNPRTHTGCDCRSFSFLRIIKKFQSTHPHGVRHTDKALPVISNQFQSTHPHGVRPSAFRLPVFVFLFQSTHPHGVRHISKTISTRYIVVSIHAPTRGATFNGFVGSARSTGFNPRTHTGCDAAEAIRQPC